MILSGTLHLPSSLQLLEGEFADGLQHAIARPHSGDIPNDETLLDQRGEGVEDIGHTAEGANHLRRLQCPSSGKDGEAAKQGLLIRVEQVVTPGNGGLEGALARRGIAWAGGQEGESSLESC